MSAWNFTEESIEREVERGGRVSAFTLLRLAEGILHGTVTPSPAVAAWFSAALARILAGEKADEAFGLKPGTGGTDPLANLDKTMRRDSDILRLVEEARRRGHPTGGNWRIESRFAAAADQMRPSEGTVKGPSEGTVKNVYYEWQELFRFVEGEW